MQLQLPYDMYKGYQRKKQTRAIANRCGGRIQQGSVQTSTGPDSGIWSWLDTHPVEWIAAALAMKTAVVLQLGTWDSCSTPLQLKIPRLADLATSFRHATKGSLHQSFEFNELATKNENYSEEYRPACDNVRHPSLKTSDDTLCSTRWSQEK